MPTSQHKPSALVALRASYRLQFHKEFPFEKGAKLAPYLAGLGISHVYSSPILTARKGSVHGYDVIAYDAINPGLGGEAAFGEMSASLRSHGIGIILDIVPNHVAVGGDDNAMWLDLLRHGPASAYASWFDVDFGCADPALSGKIHAPFLGEPLEHVLAKGELVLERQPGAVGHALRYGDNLFPIRPEDEDEIDRRGVAAFREPAALQALLDRQNFVLDHWRNAGDRINWRRFFDVTQLGAVRMDEPAAFAAAHALPLRLYAQGLIDGLRIDHIDGLADPAHYCSTLRRELDARQAQRPAEANQGRALLLVEKILASGESLPDWDVDGTTGYDFMNDVSALQHLEAAAEPLAQGWAVISGRSTAFADEEEAARRETLDHGFDGQREWLVEALAALGAEERPQTFFTRAALRRALTELLVHLRVYRSYITGEPPETALEPALETALDAALGRPYADRLALAFLREMLAGPVSAAMTDLRSRMIRRLHQLSAPLAAKAVEDTAFYRYGRLLSRNDVGFDPAELAMSASAFHKRMGRRARDWPHALLATATHDHKRGEDLRARLAVLSEMPGEWLEAVHEWFALNAAFRPPGLAAGDEYMLYQTLLGAWPLELDPGDGAGLQALSERVGAWWRKALREGKLHSGWAQPDEAYEAGALAFLDAVLDPERSAAFLTSLHALQSRIAPAGALNGLVQMALKCTLPGAPDIYQGTEFWDLSLVDPDNRRPVDYPSREAALAADVTLAELCRTWRDGRVKQRLLRDLLQLRRQESALFAAGSYEPVTVTGEGAANLLAFLRRHDGQALLVCVVIHALAGMCDADTVAPEADWWGDTMLKRPDGLHKLRPVVGAALGAGDIRVGAALGSSPIGIWRCAC